MHAKLLSLSLILGIATAQQLSATSVIEGLDTVWDIAFAPDQTLYLTERPGRISAWDGANLTVLAELEVAEQDGTESGLMGMALDPEFPDQPYMYVCYTYDEGGLKNRVERLRLDHQALVADKVLLESMQGGAIHDGCRVRFGPDGYLYITMGETGDTSLAQNLESFNGKVLRIDREGKIPGDNPFPGSPVFTYGHRNPQGLDFHPETGAPYVSEHGPSVNDEINRLEAGKNYGWPELSGTQPVQGYHPALYAWSPTVGTAGIAFYDPHTLYVATLKKQQLYKLELDDAGKVLRARGVLSGQGRLRAITLGPDNCLYIGTSSRDGRGHPRGADDRVLRVCP